MLNLLDGSTMDGARFSVPVAIIVNDYVNSCLEVR